MINGYLNNRKKLQQANVRIEDHDACGVGFVASMTGKQKREVVKNGIEALKAVWHRGAVDADGKTGDGAGIHIEFSRDFFIEQINVTGHEVRDDQEICLGMVFLPRTNYSAQERCRTLLEQELLNNDFYIFGWRQVPVNPKVLGQKANDTRPEIEQIIFACEKKYDFQELERKLFIIRKMQDVCGVKEQKIHIKILMKLYQLKSLSLIKKEK